MVDLCHLQKHIHQHTSMLSAHTKTSFQEIDLPGLCDLEPRDTVVTNPVVMVEWQS